MAGDGEEEGGCLLYAHYYFATFCIFVVCRCGAVELGAGVRSRGFISGDCPLPVHKLSVGRAGGRERGSEGGKSGGGQRGGLLGDVF